MALPQFNIPRYTATIPSTKQEITFRPYLAGEEKILLMALEGDDVNDIVQAVTHILNTCIETEGVDVSKLASFDLEYLFVVLRARSVNESLNLTMPSHQTANGETCTTPNEIVVDLNELEVVFPEGHDSKIMLSDTIGIKMKYPTLEWMQQMSTSEEPSIKQLFEVMHHSVDFVFDQDTVYESFTREELSQWFDQLTDEQFTKIYSFFENLPSLTYETEIECQGCGETKKVTLQGISDFFTYA